jgi:Lon protease-like protein
MNHDTLAASCKALRLFPLPGTVLLPGAPLPLHVFEPRYRQLVSDSIASDKLVCIPQIIEGNEGEHLGAPALYPYATVGEIVGSHLLPDGRYNVLIQPRGRVRLITELDSPTPYRVFEAELLPDNAGAEEQLVRTGKRLLALVSPVLGNMGERGDAMRKGLSQVDPARIPEALAPLLLQGSLARQEYIADNDAVHRAGRVELAALTMLAESRAGQAAEA